MPKPKPPTDVVIENPPKPKKPGFDVTFVGSGSMKVTSVTGSGNVDEGKNYHFTRAGADPAKPVFVVEEDIGKFENINDVVDLKKNRPFDIKRVGKGD